MDTKRTTPAERQFWQQAYVAALAALIRKHDGRRMSPHGVAHLAAEHASAALREYRRGQRAE